MSLSSFQKSKAEILSAYQGKALHDVPTPHLIVNRQTFAASCRKMAEAVDGLGWSFRAHIKTHKTAEGTKLQCEETKTGRIIASTIPEMRLVLEAGFVSSGLVNDMLLSMPFPIKSFETISSIRKEMADHGAVLRLMIDHPDQIQGLENCLKSAGRESEVWSIFLKLDVGTHRAGLPVQSSSMEDLITKALRSPNVHVFGTYAHAGHSYAAKDPQSAAEYLATEVSSVNEVAKTVYKVAQTLSIDSQKTLGDNGRLTLSVGATPTAHAAQTQDEWHQVRTKAGILDSQLVGSVELHAGNYCLLDMQQLATGCISLEACAMTVGATIISTYPLRREALCDAGAIAMSKDVGPFPGFGQVVSSTNGQVLQNKWKLGRMSQEHGILTTDSDEAELTLPNVGDYIAMVPQHACLTAAQHVWHLITDDGKTVADVWEPVKGW